MLRTISQGRRLAANCRTGRHAISADLRLRCRERPQHPVATSIGYQDISARTREGCLVYCLLTMTSSN